MKAERMDRPTWARAAILVLFFAAAAVADLALLSILGPVLPGALVLAVLMLIFMAAWVLGGRWGRSA